jgi:hypothetical protein
MFRESGVTILKKVSLPLVLTAIGLSNSGCTKRSVRLVSQVKVPAVAKPVQVRAVQVQAPKRGENVCNFADMAVHVPGFQWVVTYPDGSTAPVQANQVQRATFDYFLEEDSESLFADALRKAGLAEGPSSSRTAEAKAQFRYFLADRGSFTSALGIRMDLTLVVKDGTRVVSQKQYTRAEAEQYSSAWVTFPRSSTLNSLFNKALAKIVADVQADLASLSGNY